MDCYVFDTEQMAIDAEAYISENAGFPWEATHNQSNSNQKTVKWSYPKQRITDKKWFFPVVPMENILSIMSLQEAQELITYFNLNFPFTKENYQQNWVEIIEEETNDLTAAQLEQLYELQRQEYNNE